MKKTTEKKDLKNPRKEENRTDIEKLLAEYNDQVEDAGKHTYSETVHNDSCCCCDLCDLLTCCM